MSSAPPPNPVLEAYKLEYQLAASRYENIYKAIWQIFSYLAAISGALLTFGADHFQHNLLWVLASLPLFFWCVSTYLPMDRYGHSCLDRLAPVKPRCSALKAKKTVCRMILTGPTAVGGYQRGAPALRM